MTTMNQKIDRLLSLLEDMEANDYLGYREDFVNNFNEAMTLANELKKEIDNIPDFYTG